MGHRVFGRHGLGVGFQRLLLWACVIGGLVACTQSLCSGRPGVVRAATGLNAGSTLLQTGVGLTRSVCLLCDVNSLNQVYVAPGVSCQRNDLLLRARACTLKGSGK